MEPGQTVSVGDILPTSLGIIPGLPQWQRVNRASIFFKQDYNLIRKENAVDPWLTEFFHFGRMCLSTAEASDPCYFCRELPSPHTSAIYIPFFRDALYEQCQSTIIKKSRLWTVTVSIH
jgi:hypothetical protein